MTTGGQLKSNLGETFPNAEIIVMDESYDIPNKFIIWIWKKVVKLLVKKVIHYSNRFDCDNYSNMGIVIAHLIFIIFNQSSQSSQSIAIGEIYYKHKDTRFNHAINIICTDKDGTFVMVDPQNVNKIIEIPNKNVYFIKI